MAHARAVPRTTTSLPVDRASLVSQRRDNARQEEYISAPSPTLGMNAATFTGLLYGGYCTIGGINMVSGEGRGFT